MGNGPSLSTLERTEPVRVVTGVRPPAPVRGSPPSMSPPRPTSAPRLTGASTTDPVPAVDSILLSGSRVDTHAGAPAVPDSGSPTLSRECVRLVSPALSSVGGVGDVAPRRVACPSEVVGPESRTRSRTPPSRSRSPNAPHGDGRRPATLTGASPTRVEHSPSPVQGVASAAAAVVRESDFDTASQDSWSDDAQPPAGCMPVPLLGSAFLSFVPGESDHWAVPRDRLSFSEGGKRVGFGYNRSASSTSIQATHAAARLTASMDRTTLAGGGGGVAGGGELPPLRVRNSITTGSLRGTSASSGTKPLSSQRQHPSGEYGVTTGERTESYTLSTSVKSSQDGVSQRVMPTSPAHSSRGSPQTPVPRTSSLPLPSAHDLSRSSSLTQDHPMGSRRNSSTVCFTASVEMLNGASASYTQALPPDIPHRDALAQRSAASTPRTSRYHLAPLWVPTQPSTARFAARPGVAQILSLHSASDEDLLRGQSAGVPPTALMDTATKPKPLRSRAPSIGKWFEPTGERRPGVSPRGPRACSTSAGGSAGGWRSPPAVDPAALPSTLPPTTRGLSSPRSGTLLRASADTVAGAGEAGRRASGSAPGGGERGCGRASSRSPSPPMPQEVVRQPATAGDCTSAGARLGVEKVKAAPMKPVTHAQRCRLQLRQPQDGGGGSAPGHDMPVETLPGSSRSSVSLGASETVR